MCKYAVCLCCFFLILFIPQLSFSANAAISKAEWAELMQDQEFKTADQKLGEAYKQTMSALSDAGKQKLLTEQRAWGAKREQEAFAKFGKGTPNYKRFLIDKAYARITELQSYTNNKAGLAKESKTDRTVEFKNEKIPMTVYVTYDADEQEILNRLVFNYKGIKHTVPLTNFEEPLQCWTDISAADYNFDNCMDIAIDVSCGSYNLSQKIFLYDPQTKKYEYHKELSEILGVWVDSETKTIKSHAKGGHAGLIYYFSEYSWKSGKLTLIQKESQDYDDNLGIYIRITRTLQNGVWKEKTEKFKEADLM
ncbi:MAG: lysozyme inhibitor LprI family protein [Deferribacteraceae bacterium]|jgi:uncharacterized protein YecT (DUF1311 family)|nr:lysozyme inhibitor LprI family protein [Deferribacteraceae bacterium]